MGARLCWCFRAKRSDSIRIACMNMAKRCRVAADEGRESAMSLVAEEIRDQPRAWSLAIDLAPRASGAAPGRRADRGDRLRQLLARGEGARGAPRASRGQGRRTPSPPRRRCSTRGYDRVVAISRSGATTEILRALELVRPGTPTVALVGDPLSPVAARCDQVVDLSFADDRSVVQTRFVTTVVCFARAVPRPRASTGLLADAEAALAEPHPADAGVDRARGGPRERVAGRAGRRRRR